MLVSIITFIIVLSVLILVHELGHFFAAKKAGVWVEEFGFGIPPRVFGKKFGDTIYSINLLPFGGFVRLHGEVSEENITDHKRSFLGKSKKVRLIIVTAGVLMNVLLGIFSFSVVYSFLGIPQKTNNVRIVAVGGGTPASDSGLRINDVVKKADGAEIVSSDVFINILHENAGQEILLYVERQGEDTLVEIPVTPRTEYPEGDGPLGVAISTYENYFPPFWKRPFLGAYHGVKEAVFWGGVVIAGFINILKQLFSGTVPNDVAGPVGIFALTSQAANYGLLTLINFVGILSINLAILNIFPFPALDGGRLLFIVIETFLGRKVMPKIESAIHMVGMAILLLMVLAITIFDIRRVIEAGGLSGFIENMIEQ